MGDEKVTVETLASGEQVHDHPPTPEFPDGRQVLAPRNAIAEMLQGKAQEHQDANDALLATRLEAVAEKRQSLAADPAVPSEKSPL